VLSPDARALSGLEISGGADLTFQISKTGRAETGIEVLAFGRSYVLSGKAQRIAPDVKGGDFAYGGIGTALVHRRRFGRLSSPTVMKLGVAQTWYSGATYDRVVRAMVSQAVRVGRRTILNCSISLEQRVFFAWPLGTSTDLGAARRRETPAWKWRCAGYFCGG
jgi:hypothetical protein